MTQASESGRAMSDQSALLIVGNPSIFHMGSHLLQAAQTLSIPAEIYDTQPAFAAPWLLRQFTWRFLGHRPPRLGAYGSTLLARCRQAPPRWLLATGAAPLQADVLHSLGDLGICRICFLTDDPWNPAQRAAWFLAALPHYDLIFTPRRANLDDLFRLGCRQVQYLPFAYAPHIHYVEQLASDRRGRFECDVLFYGGADADRLPYISALIEAGLTVHLYGGYWDRHARTRSHFRGHADPQTLRHAVADARITLCLVRRANRDGHVMRTFEAPAMGGCLLTEDTPEHRLLLGEDGITTVYFSTVTELVQKAQRLLAHPEERRRLAHAAHARITQGKNTYADRLQTILAASEAAV